MILTEINKYEILKNFNSIEQFNIAINEACLYLNHNCKMMMQNIKIYYNNIFEYDVYMISDVLNLYDMALCSIDALKKLYSENPLFVFKFLYERIKGNVLYVDSIKKLA